MIHEWVLWIGAHFSPEQYLLWTRVQCLAWTAADLVIVFYLYRIANLARGLAHRPPHRIPYVVLALTVLLVPFVVIAETGWRIFALELAITVPHFLLILHVLAANTVVIGPALRKLLGAGVRS